MSAWRAAARPAGRSCRSGSGPRARAAAGFGQIDAQRWAPNRLPEVSPFAEYNQWKEATGEAREKLSPLPAGFEIEKLHAAREGEDSWVSLAIDAQGRFIVGKEQKGLLRITLPAQQGGEVLAEHFAEGLLECRGLVWREDGLYANANRSRGLFRLRDADGDDVYDEIALLQETEKAGGRKTQSALYRVRYTGGPQVPQIAGGQATARSAFSQEARARRRALESQHGDPVAPGFEEAWEALGDPDPWIRNAARVAVETRSPGAWRERALGEDGELRGLTALLALARAGGDGDRAGAARRVADFESGNWRRTEKLTAMRVYEPAGRDALTADARLAARVREQVGPWASSVWDPVRREVERVLVAAADFEEIFDVSLGERDLRRG